MPFDAKYDILLCIYIFILTGLNSLTVTFDDTTVVRPSVQNSIKDDQSYLEAL